MKKKKPKASKKHKRSLRRHWLILHKSHFYEKFHKKSEKVHQFHHLKIILQLRLIDFVMVLINRLASAIKRLIFFFLGGLCPFHRRLLQPCLLLLNTRFQKLDIQHRGHRRHQGQLFLQVALGVLQLGIQVFLQHQGRLKLAGLWVQLL